MTPAGRRSFILGFLALLGVIASLLFLSRTRPAAPVLSPSLSATGRIPGSDQASPSVRPEVVVEAPAHAELPLIQVPLNRPLPGHFDAAGLRPLREPNRPPSGPVDKRGPPGPNAAREMEILGYAFETLEEDVRACLEQWEAAAPGEASEVMIAFEIDSQGLQKSWLEHQTDVPFGPRTCLANAVYGLDWSNIVDHPAKLTQRFELGKADAR